MAGAAEPGPPVRRELGHPAQRHRQLVGGQAGQRGGGQRDDALADRLGQRSARARRPSSPSGWLARPDPSVACLEPASLVVADMRVECSAPEAVVVRLGARHVPSLRTATGPTAR